MDVLIERLPELDRQVQVYEAWGKRDAPTTILNDLNGWLQRLWHVPDLSVVMFITIQVRSGVPTGWFEVGL
jgi:hypothetical protein